jgi:hypothetical protein
MFNILFRKPSKPSKQTDADLIATLQRIIERLAQEIDDIDKALGQPRSETLDPVATRLWLIRDLQNVESELRLCPGSLKPVQIELSRRAKFLKPISSGF